MTGRPNFEDEDFGSEIVAGLWNTTWALSDFLVVYPEVLHAELQAAVMKRIARCRTCGRWQFPPELTGGLCEGCKQVARAWSLKYVLTEADKEFLRQCGVAYGDPPTHLKHVAWQTAQSRGT